MYVLTSPTLWDPSYECTPTLWGLQVLWGHTPCPQNNIRLNRSNMIQLGDVWTLVDDPTKSNTHACMYTVGTNVCSCIIGNTDVLGTSIHKFFKMAMLQQNWAKFIVCSHFCNNLVI